MPICGFNAKDAKGLFMRIYFVRAGTVLFSTDALRLKETWRKRRKWCLGF